MVSLFPKHKMENLVQIYLKKFLQACDYFCFHNKLFPIKDNLIFHSFNRAASKLWMRFSQRCVFRTVLHRISKRLVLMTRRTCERMKWTIINQKHPKLHIARTRLFSNFCQKSNFWNIHERTVHLGSQIETTIIFLFHISQSVAIMGEVRAHFFRTL